MNNTQSLPTSTGEVLYTVALFAVIILALTGNAIVCLAFYRYSTFRNATVTFILSLAITDILVASVSIPLWLSMQLSLCRFPTKERCNNALMAWKILDVLFSTASIMNLCAISVDRLVIITKPLRYPNIMTAKRANTGLAAIWIFATTLSALVAVGWKNYPTFVFVLAFLVPLAIMISSYSLIFKTALTQARRVFPIRQAYYFKRELKAAKTLGIVMGTFIACWAPFFLVNLIISYRKDLVPSPEQITGIKMLHYVNSALNPFIYSCSNKEFRFKILRVLPWKCGAGRQLHMIDRVVFWSTTLTPSTDLDCNPSFTHASSLKVTRNNPMNQEVQNSENKQNENEN